MVWWARGRQFQTTAVRTLRAGIGLFGSASVDSLGFVVVDETVKAGDAITLRPGSTELPPGFFYLRQRSTERLREFNEIGEVNQVVSVQIVG